MGFYEDMQQTATGLLREFQQGVCSLVQTQTTRDPERSHDFQRSEGDPIPLSAVVRTVSRDMINGTTIVGGEDMVLFAHPGVAPQVKDVIVVDGRSREILGVRQIPGAGTPVVWKAVVAF